MTTLMHHAVSTLLLHYSAERITHPQPIKECFFLNTKLEAVTANSELAQSYGFRPSPAFPFGFKLTNVDMGVDLILSIA